MPNKVKQASQRLLHRLRAKRKRSSLDPSSAPAQNGSQAPQVQLPQSHQGLVDEAPTKTLRDRPFIKIKIVTFNQCQSLPTGDLTELLGEIPAHLLQQSPAKTAASPQTSEDVSQIESAEEGLPALPRDAAHPYHLIVVGSQESPWVPSTFLGDLSSSFNLRGKPNVSWTDLLDDYLCRGGGVPRKSTAEPREELGRPESPALDKYSEGGQRIQPSKTAPATVEVKDFALPPSQRPTVQLSPTLADSRESPQLARRASSSSLESVQSSLSDSDRRDAKSLGPYVLVAKERLMGIYIAVFALTSCQHLIRGMSKGRVTTGLLAGRGPNKGASAVSLRFADFRLLFLSAHLAAHQSQTSVRKANLQKIKDELEIDDFEMSGREKKPVDQEILHSKKDLTDKFDFTFLFGDLNFRLDISRLHADWLLRTKSYDTALAFDQLTTLLKEKDSVLKGFQEAPIQFAPTYKYDLIQFGKRKSYRRSIQQNKSMVSPSVENPASASPVSKQEEFSDTASISSALTASAFDQLGEPKLLTTGSEISHSASMFSAPPDPNEAALSPAAVSRAKVKFLSLVRSKSSLQVNSSGLGEDERDSGIAMTPSASSSDIRLERPPLRSIKSEVALPTDSMADGVYDTSKKQRVQSYCDRILFKTTLASVRPQPTSSQRRIGSGLLQNLRTVSRTLSQTSSPLLASELPCPPSSQHKVSFSSDMPPLLRSAKNSTEPVSYFDVKSRASTTSEDQMPSTSSIIDEDDAQQQAEHDALQRANSVPGSYRRHVKPRQASHGNLTELRGQAPNHKTVSSFDSADASSSPSARPHLVPRHSEPLEPVQTQPKHDFHWPFAATHSRRLSRATSMSSEKPVAFHWRHWLHFFAHPTSASNPSMHEGTDESPLATPLLVEYVGPRRGEVDCVLYDSVNDLRRMQATSDHRPVFGVFHLGTSTDDKIDYAGIKRGV